MIIKCFRHLEVCLSVSILIRMIGLYVVFSPANYQVLEYFFQVLFPHSCQFILNSLYLCRMKTGLHSTAIALEAAHQRFENSKLILMGGNSSVMYQTYPLSMLSFKTIRIREAFRTNCQSEFGYSPKGAKNPFLPPPILGQHAPRT